MQYKISFRVYCFSLSLSAGVGQVVQMGWPLRDVFISVGAGTSKPNHPTQLLLQNVLPDRPMLVH